MRTAARRLLGRVLLVVALLVLKRRMRRMADQTPTMTANDVARMHADGGPDDMVLLAADGTLTLDSTPDDIDTYQQAGVWPRYVCRVSTISDMLNRGTAEQAAARLNSLMGRQLAAAPRRPASAAPIPPGNAPVHLGGSAVTIRPE